VRRDGVRAARRLAFYASSEAHGAIAKACALLGLGEAALRQVPAGSDFRMSVPDLAAMIAADRAEGVLPAAVIASAGTVNTGAIDDLAAIAALCRAEHLWLHVDAAFGGLAILVPDHRSALAPMREADSIAFDFHKWLQVPYDAGCVLVRNEALHRASFSARREYLAHDGAALAGGDPWFCEYGPEMSRGFRALKIWFTIKAYGIADLAGAIARNCADARHLGKRVAASRELELLAPVSLNIVCFRFASAGLPQGSLDAVNEAIVAALHRSGIAAPSTTRIGGCLAIRACLVNHRTTTADLDLLACEVERLGHALTREAA
jgi:aromatic-L-amino-acid decarboxylase